jgi:hypothetical protein
LSHTLVALLLFVAAAMLFALLLFIAIAFNGGWANLLSRNGVEHGGFDAAGNEMRLDNEVYAARGCIVFDQSKAAGCVARCHYEDGNGLRASRCARRHRQSWLCL